MVELSRNSSETYDWGLEDEDDGGNSYLPEMSRLDSAMDEPKLTRGFSFTQIEEKDIESRQSKMVDRVIEYLKVSPCVSRALLIKYQWDDDKLIRESTMNENIVR